MVFFGTIAIKYHYFAQKKLEFMKEISNNANQTVKINQKIS